MPKLLIFGSKMPVPGFLSPTSFPSMTSVNHKTIVLKNHSCDLKGGRREIQRQDAGMAAYVGVVRSDAWVLLRRTVETEVVAPPTHPVVAEVVRRVDVPNHEGEALLGERRRHYRSKV